MLDAGRDSGVVPNCACKAGGARAYDSERGSDFCDFLRIDFSGFSGAAEGKSELVDTRIILDF